MSGSFASSTSSTFNSTNASSNGNNSNSGATNSSKGAGQGEAPDSSNRRRSVGDIAGERPRSLGRLSLFPSAPASGMAVMGAVRGGGGGGVGAFSSAANQIEGDSHGVEEVAGRGHSSRSSVFAPSNRPVHNGATADMDMGTPRGSLSLRHTISVSDSVKLLSHGPSDWDRGSSPQGLPALPILSKDDLLAATDAALSSATSASDFALLVRTYFHQIEGIEAFFNRYEAIFENVMTPYDAAAADADGECAGAWGQDGSAASGYPQDSNPTGSNGHGSRGSTNALILAAAAVGGAGAAAGVSEWYYTDEADPGRASMSVRGSPTHTSNAIGGAQQALNHAAMGEDPQMLVQLYEMMAAMQVRRLSLFHTGHVFLYCIV